VFIFSFITGDQRSKEDVIHNISTSIFVTNFPDQTNAKELWRFSNQYGNVIDAFILDRRSKIDKRFGFIRFIKVADVDRLINNLCTIWIGKFKLHANVARFNRLHLNNGSQHVAPTAMVGIPSVETFNKGGAHGTSNSYMQAFKTGSSSKAVMEESKPSMVLDHSFYNNFDSSLSLVGKLNQDVSSDSDVGSEDVNDDALSENGKEDSHSEADIIPETVFEECEVKSSGIKEKSNELQQEAQSEDPFKIYNLLKTKHPVSNVARQYEDEPMYPPGFTPCDNSANIDSSFCGAKIHQKESSKRRMGDVIVMGDFNEVRFAKERFKTIFNARGDTVFNSFITSRGLVEVPTGGYSFTWSHKSAAKMSKLERFLIFEDLMSNCPNLSAVILDHYLSNHRPILLREMCVDYGPYPFRFFNYWFELEGFDSFVADTWRSNNILECNALLKLIKKLKLLKGCIRTWVHDKKEISQNLKKCLKNKLFDIDISLDKGESTSAMLDESLSIINDLTSLENNVSLELPQKAKIKWAIKGDENSKFFHGIINKHRNNLAVHGIIADGESIEEPNAVIFSHYRDLFDRLCKSRLTLDMEFPNKLSADKSHYLERPFLMEEVKGDVYWSIIEDDVLKAVNYFFQNGYYHKRGNSSFIALISKIPGAKMVKDFRPISLIGSLYKIIAKLLANRLVKLWKVSLHNVVSAGLFKGVNLDNSLQFSHIFYADGVVFVGQWCDSNLFTIIKVLDCFSHASGLRINLHKSKLIGIVVDQSMVEAAASNIGSSKEKGGLGVSGFHALNRALTFKWIWRFRTQGSSLWSKVIKLIHEEDGKIGKSFKHGLMSNWNNITRGITLLQNKGIDLLGYIKKKKGNGENTLFWDEVWKSDVQVVKLTSDVSFSLSH
nr:RNA-directed DNA polymerase, eukaryota [Tanacetum cinerariifolium]